MNKLKLKRSIGVIIIIFLIGLNFASCVGGIENVKNSFRPKEITTENRGLIAHWSFDEGSGSTASDNTGHGYDGDIIGATWTTGFSGFALKFNGEDAYVDLDEHSVNIALNKTDNFEISLYMKTTSDTTGDIIGFGDSSGINPGFKIIYNSNGTITFNVRRLDCGITLTSNVECNDDEWYFVNLKFFGSDTNPTVELYVDDVIQDSETDWVCPFDSNEYVRAKIGRRSNNETSFFDGVIDEIKLYKYGEDFPPSAPDIYGDVEIKKGKEFDFIFNSEDPEDSEVYYQIKWGDGEEELWIGPYPSGVNATVSHSWSEKGEFEIEARAKDENDNIGEWSTFAITVPKIKSYHMEFYSLRHILNHFSYLFPILKTFLGL
jgi:hypothetical protein